MEHSKELKIKIAHALQQQRAGLQYQLPQQPQIPITQQLQQSSPSTSSSNPGGLVLAGTAAAAKTGTIVALASNPVGWVIGGALAIGGLFYWLNKK